MSSFNTANNISNNNSSNFNQSNPSNINVNSNVTYQTLRNRKTNKSTVPLDERVSLEKAFGFTIQSNSRIAQSCDGTVAYLAGCVIVLYDCNNIHNQEFIISPAKKTLTCLAFSLDGRTIATGESGHEPKVRVWDVREKIQLCEFSGHKFSIDCVSFSTAPNSNLLVSVGSMFDMVVNVWNYRTKFKVASNKIACKVKGIAFSQDGSYFVTVGNRHVKFWYLTVSSLLETVPLRGRAAILGDMKNNYFCDVACGKGPNSHLTYAITTNGILCEFNENRCLSSIAELHVERAYCIYADDANLFIGCSNGTILIFRQKILDCISSLSRPHYLGVDISKGFDTSHVIANINNPDIKHPDCIALCYDKYDFILSAFYNDHSFYVWDIKDLTKVKKIDSQLFHSSSCGSIDLFSSAFLSNTNNEITLPNSPLSNDSCYNMPMDSFITCSSDNTVRIWSMNNQTKSNSRLNRNIYSKELLKIIYIDNDMSSLCEIDSSLDISDLATTPLDKVKQSTDQRWTRLPNPAADTTQNDTVKLGARCIKISPYGRHLATGDRNGNIRIYDLSTLESICMIEAHIAEVLDLQYSQPESGRQLLASSSRDRLIHIFDASGVTYDLLQIIGDHSAAITAVRFCFNTLEKQLYIISCGADKSIMFRTAVVDSNSNNNSQGSSTNASPNHQININQPVEYGNFVRTSYVAEKQTFHDLNVDPTRNYLNTISQDRMVREYSIKDGKKIRQFRGSLNEDGYLLKMDIDRSGQLLATSCTDKVVYIWDLKSTDCLAYLSGHSENINDLKFTSDGQHLITVGAEGCMFIWRINNLYNYLSNTNSNNLVNSFSMNLISIPRNPVTRQSVPNGNIPILPLPTVNKENIASRQLSLDTIFDDMDESLPAWAKKKLDSSITSKNTLENSSRSSWSISTGNLEVEQVTRTRRSGRAVWGPVINTSFAVDSEMNIKITPTTETPSSQHTDLQLTPENLKSQKIINENENTPVNNKFLNNNNFENNILFPSPCVNKESYQVKQISIEHKDIHGSVRQRPNWIYSNNEDDIIFNLNRLSSEDLSSDDIDTPNSNINSPVKIDECEEIENFNKNQETDNTTPTRPDEDFKILNDFKSDSKISVENTVKSLDFNSDYTNILDEDFKLNTPTQRQPPVNKNCFSLADKPIKLDCDMENSFRRQSISAKYLLRTAQQKENYCYGESVFKEEVVGVSEFTPVKNIIKPTFEKEERANLSEAFNQIKIEVATPEQSNCELMPAPPVPAPLIVTDFKIKSRTNRSGGMGGKNYQLLYSHQTESSLRKTKPKQPQQFHSSNNLKEISTSESNKSSSSNSSTQQSMKRSPSVSSINIATQDNVSSKSQESSSSLTSSSATSSTSSIKQISKSISISAKSSPVKQSSILARSNNFENKDKTANIHSGTPPVNSNSNLKKASSMISLNQSNEKQNNKSSTRKSSIKIENNPSPNVVKESTAVFLPPKTVRQVKQRSSERQYTTPPPPPPSSSSNSTHKSVNLNSLNTFSEQNKHLRKLSNSIQNLHQSTGHKNLHKPPMKPSTKQIIENNKDEKPHKLIKNNEINGNEIDLMDKLKKIDTDQMSLSSSSVEYLDLGQKNDDYNDDIDLNNQPHSSSHTSNSLTSSSSSSCSLFENNTNPERDNNIQDNKNEINDEKNSFNKNMNNQVENSQRFNDIDLSSFNLTSFKKPVTFASMAAAKNNNNKNNQGLMMPKSKSANNSPNIISFTSQSKFSNGNSNGFSNSKIDSIRSEFIQNIKNLEFVLNQGTKNLHDYAKYQQAGHQAKSLVNEQTQHHIQVQYNAFVKQLNAVINASKQQHTSSNTNNSELELV